MNRDQAIQAAQQVGVAPGETITLQSAGQIDNPHYHSGQTSGQTHVDGWAVTNNGNSFSADKIHSNG